MGPPTHTPLHPSAVSLPPTPPAPGASREDASGVRHTSFVATPHSLFVHILHLKDS